MCRYLTTNELIFDRMNTLYNSLNFSGIKHAPKNLGWTANLNLGQAAPVVLPAKNNWSVAVRKAKWLDVEGRIKDCFL